MILKDFIVYIEICLNRSKCRRKKLSLEMGPFKSILVSGTARPTLFKCMNFIPNGGYLSPINISNGLISKKSYFLIKRYIENEEERYYKR